MKVEFCEPQVFKSMTFVLKTIFFVIIFHAILADRQETINAIERLKDAQESYDNFRDYVIKETTNAKLRATNSLIEFYEDVLQIKELFLQQSLWAEEEMVYQINSQTIYPTINVNYKCINFTRILVGYDMNVAGVHFTNCALDVDEQIKVEIVQVIDDMQQDTEIAQWNALGTMNRTNIILRPDETIPKIKEQQQYLETLIPLITAELNLAINKFSANLGALGKSFRACSMDNDNILKAAFDNIKSQIVQICKGRLI
ncbi:uncharacterized protein LOC131432256 [Malaya genurostris]|uniref:uncharacterized protein LOC131432256 n=1 Tax=Malaya genurostris TaxID=325434 RepID=UPI0026F3A313|nr:uncharacterized protein LOC131432256 [Malaya genurostris]